MWMCYYLCSRRSDLCSQYEELAITSQYFLSAAVALLFSACDPDVLTTTLNESYSCESADKINSEMLRLLNAARSEARRCGDTTYEAASMISWDIILEEAARIHSEDMADHDFVSHTGSDGSTAGDRLINNGYAWDISAENISAGVKTSEEAVAGWLTSPGHCANIMHPALEEIGAACFCQSGTKYVTYWTLELATSY